MKVVGWSLVALLLVATAIVGAISAFRPDVLSFSIRPYGSICTQDGEIAAQERAAIEKAARDFVAALLSDAPQAAFEALSSAAVREVRREQLTALAPQLKSIAATSEPAVSRTYLVRSTGGVRPGTRAPCGRSPNMDFVAIGGAMKSAHVLLTDDLPGAERTWSIWMEFERGAWRVTGFFAGLSAICGRSGTDLWAAARAQRAKGHMFNAALLYGAAQTTLNRGAYFQPAIAQEFQRDLSTFSRPPEMAHKPPFPWTLNGKAFTILGIQYMGVADGNVVLQMAQPWPDTQGESGAVQRNHELIDAFVAVHPEWVEAVDAIVVRSVRSNPNNSYGTVYKNEGGYLTENAGD